MYHILNNLSYFLLNFLWFFSRNRLGCNVLSLFFFLKLMEARCSWMALWASCSVICEFFLLSFIVLSSIFSLFLNLPKSRRYFVELFGANFLREHLPDDQIVKKFTYAAGIAGLLKIFGFLIAFFTNF